LNPINPLGAGMPPSCFPNPTDRSQDHRHLPPVRDHGRVRSGSPPTSDTDQAASIAWREVAGVSARRPDVVRLVVPRWVWQSGRREKEPHGERGRRRRHVLNRVSSTFQWFLITVLGAAFSAGIAVATYHGAVAPVFRNRAVAAAVGVVLGFAGAVGLVAELFHWSREKD
jgi:hypothetical protein